MREVHLLSWDVYYCPLYNKVIRHDGKGLGRMESQIITREFMRR